MKEIIELILNTDDALLALVTENVNKAYFVLFVIIMLETGLILFPFLPGDGLLFSAGVITATTELDISILLPLLIIAAIAGNLLNYTVGSYMGAGIRTSNNYIIRKFLVKRLPKAESYYEKHGSRAVIIGRFFPIIRTYIPFVAGIAQMNRKLFIKNTAIGGVLWISSFLSLGFFLGEIEWVKNNYGLIFLFLILISVIPFVLVILRNLFFKK
jgi:membrane-associated protein